MRLIRRSRPPATRIFALDFSLATKSCCTSFVISIFIGWIAGAATAGAQAQEEQETRRWLAGDHHIHSHFSRKLDMSTDPPTLKPDAIYSIPMNAVLAKRFG